MLQGDVPYVDGEVSAEAGVPEARALPTTAPRASRLGFAQAHLLPTLRADSGDADGYPVTCIEVFCHEPGHDRSLSRPNEAALAIAGG